MKVLFDTKIILDVSVYLPQELWEVYEIRKP